jgi:hypothetical protein
MQIRVIMFVEDNNMRLSPIQSRYFTIFNNDTDNRDKLSDVNIEIEGKMHQV